MQAFNTCFNACLQCKNHYEVCWFLEYITVPWNLLPNFCLSFQNSFKGCRTLMEYTVAVQTHEISVLVLEIIQRVSHSQSKSNRYMSERSV